MGGLCLLGLIPALWSCQEAPGKGKTAAVAEKAAAGTTWMKSPRIDRLEADDGEWVIGGLTDPGGRVVFRLDRDGADDGRTYAGVADNRGRFEVRVSERDARILTPEVQSGQEAVAAPERLVILADGAPSARMAAGALLSPGLPSRRLGPAPALGAVDRDAGMMLLSGRTVPGGDVVIEWAGRGGVPVRSDGAGFWRIALEGAPPLEVKVAGEIFLIPSMSLDAETDTVQLAVGEAGTLIRWRAPDGAALASWLPHAGPAR